MLQSVNSFLSPVQERSTRRRGPASSPGDDDIIIVSGGDDVVVSSPGGGASPSSSPVREFPLKVRCPADLQKMAVLSVRGFLSTVTPPAQPCDHCLLFDQSTPLSAVLDRLSGTLGVPRHRLLLLREEVELPADATVGELGLGIADIIGQWPPAAMLQVVFGFELQSDERVCC